MKSYPAVAALAALCLLAPLKSKAEQGLSLSGLDQLNPPIEKVVVFGSDPRETVTAFAEHNHLDVTALRRQHSGSGVIFCGNARGAGQLTLTDNVVTTAAHVFYDEQGKLRGDADHCEFVIESAGRAIATPIDVKSIIAGSTNPYPESAVHDWAVARLTRSLGEASPYQLGAAASGAPIRFVARGHSDWGGGREMSLENCRLRDGLESGSEGTREFAFDCAAGIGASGSALLNAAGSRLIAVFVGYRSTAPDERQAFSLTHYNFAVTVEGAFRRAVEREAETRTAGGP